MTSLDDAPFSRKINRLQLNDKTNAWNTILAPSTPKAALESEIQADWLVIGTGYAGLSAARRLAQNCPDQKIVIVDAGVCVGNMEEQARSPATCPH